MKTQAIMEHLDLILGIASFFMIIISILLGRLVWISNEQRKDQKEQNKLNASEHAAIFERLTKGMGWFNDHAKDIKRNSGDIKDIKDEVTEHHDDLIIINQKIKYKIVD